MQALRPNPQAMPQQPGPSMPKMATGGQPPVYTHHVVDPRRNNAIMGKYQSAVTARRAADRLDNQYGAYRYRVQPIPKPNATSTHDIDLEERKL